MREHGIRGYIKRRRVRTTIPEPSGQKVPDLLGRDFTAEGPNQRYVGDITYLPLADGKNLYLATVIDCYSRRLAGWAVAGHIRTELAESFNATLKREVLQDAACWPDEATCRRQVFRWLVRYNTRRRHAWCGYLSPSTYEARRATTLPTAA